MKFLVYSSTNSRSIKSNLGGVDYSYYFVLKSYLPLLQQFGEVVVLEEPLTTDNCPDSNGEDILYLSFTPPHRVELEAGARTIPVFAWEFGTLPDEEFVSKNDNWKYVLEHMAGAITHSQFAVDVVKRSLGSDYPVVSIPAPIWESQEEVRKLRDAGKLALGQLQLNCTIIDSADFTYSKGSLLCSGAESISELPRIGASWEGEPMELGFTPEILTPVNCGFSEKVPGEMSLDKPNSWLVLPAFIARACVLELDLVCEESVDGDLLQVALGDSLAQIRLEKGLLRHRIILEPGYLANILSFSLEGSHPGVHAARPRIEKLRVSKPDLGVIDREREADLTQMESVFWYGVYHVESWGRWTGRAVSGVCLPYTVARTVRVSFNIVNSLLPPGHTFQVQLGDKTTSVVFDSIPQRVECLFADVTATDYLCLRGLEAELESAERELGLGISNLQVKASNSVQAGGDVEKFGNILTDEALYRAGFHDQEPWGRWTSKDQCAVVLSRAIAGDIEVTLAIKMNLHQQTGPLLVRLGETCEQVLLSGAPEKVKIQFRNIPTTDLLRIDGIHSQQLDQSADPRLLGLGFSSITIKPSGRTTPPTDSREDWVVYTAVFSLVDGRKNWPDILNAFVFALREHDNAVLLVKVVHAELQPFVDDLISYFSDLAPFKCRMIFIRGYLSDDQYQSLIHATDFIVNASAGEGQCLPLMEFMSSGVPAIAPNNTAMADYICADNAFIAESTIEPAVWPQDPRLLLRTTRYRVNWESLFNALSESYRVASQDSERYARMKQAATQSLHQYCSLEQANARLATFLDLTRERR